MHGFVLSQFSTLVRHNTEQIKANVHCKFHQRSMRFVKWQQCMIIVTNDVRNKMCYSMPLYKTLPIPYQYPTSVVPYQCVNRSCQLKVIIKQHTVWSGRYDLVFLRCSAAAMVIGICVLRVCSNPRKSMLVNRLSLSIQGV